MRQLNQIDDLQKVDAGLLIALPNYQHRKQKLEWYYEINYGTKHLVIKKGNDLVVKFPQKSIEFDSQ